MQVKDLLVLLRDINPELPVVLFNCEYGEVDDASGVRVAQAADIGEYSEPGSTVALIK
jgi:hypothetical protein